MKINVNEKKAKKDEFTYEVIDSEKIASRRGGWDLELRYISWNGNDPKYDIRLWKTGDDGREISGKGITMSGEELLALAEKLAEMTKEDEE